ncbi:MAG: RNA methyltransferase [Ruminiclostridium sp.]|nr:RNA methyltransferase [Ruminiclostridium sp.]
MGSIIGIADLSAPELAPFRTADERELIRQGVFIAESPKVIRTALAAGYEPVSVLAERGCITGRAADIAEGCSQAPIYTADRGTLEALTGYRLTQGILCLMRRKELPEPGDVLRGAARIAVLENIMNQTNVGAIFRSAAALGVDAVLLTEACSDTLLRRTVRVSMGAVFQVPWCVIPGRSPEYVGALASMGFSCAAMALHGDPVSIDDPSLCSEPRLALFFGTEDSGLKPETIAACSRTVKIPMSRGVDSLNVAAASAVAFWQTRIADDR